MKLNDDGRKGRFYGGEMAALEEMDVEGFERCSSGLMENVLGDVREKKAEIVF